MAFEAKLRKKYVVGQEVIRTLLEYTRDFATIYRNQNKKKKRNKIMKQ